ncbi:hypothetical protein [Burkholderia phage FLC9]|nr:hypothetical protein [Burkholderia phage FLC9]
MNTVAYEDFPRQENFLNSVTGEERGWGELERMGFAGIGRHLLKWAHGKNNSVLNTGYGRWQRVLMYGLEAGPGYEAVIFSTQGDFGSKSGNSSMLHRTAKVIRFHDSDVLRVRYLMHREFAAVPNTTEPMYLVGLFDQDYPVYRVPLYTSDRDGEIGVDLANHILSGTFLFTDVEPSHPEEPPLTINARYQTFTSITPVQVPYTD